MEKKGETTSRSGSRCQEEYFAEKCVCALLSPRKAD